jgi:hypothetical protein
MCRYTKWAFCTDLKTNNPLALPPERFTACRHLPRLESDAKAAGPDSVKAQRLSNHRNCKLLVDVVLEDQNIDRSTDCCEYGETKFLHVGGVLPPGTCVPDPKRTMKHATPGKDKAVKQVYVLCFLHTF